MSVDNGVMVRASKPQEQRLKEGSKGSTCLLALDGAWSVKEGRSLVSIQQILCFLPNDFLRVCVSLPPP